LSAAVAPEGTAIPVPARTFTPPHGSTTIPPYATHSRTPNLGYDGSDSYSYTATTADGEDSATGVVNFTVTEVNDLTVVTPQSNTLAENTSVSGNVVSGAVDADGSDITVTAGTLSTAHGS